MRTVAECVQPNRSLLKPHIIVFSTSLTCAIGAASAVSFPSSRRVGGWPERDASGRLRRYAKCRGRASGGSKGLLTIIRSKLSVKHIPQGSHIHRETDSSSRFRARHASRDDSLSRSSAYARFKARYSENICEHKQPKSWTCRSLSGPGFAASVLILSLRLPTAPTPRLPPLHRQVSEIRSP